MKRWYLGQVSGAVILTATLTLSGCATNWVATAREIVGVLIPAATNVVTLVTRLQGKNVSPSELALVQNAGTEASADLQLIQALLAAYEAADEMGKKGILNQIQNVISGLKGNLQGFITGLHIKDPAVQSKVTAVVEIVLTEVEALDAIVPVIQGQRTGSGEQGKALPRISMRSKAPLSSGEFVKSYNSVLKARSGNAELDRVTAGLQIH